MAQIGHFIALTEDALEQVTSGHIAVLDAPEVFSATIDKSWALLRYIFSYIEGAMYAVPMYEACGISSPLERGAYVLSVGDVRRIAEAIQGIDADAVEYLCEKNKIWSQPLYPLLSEEDREGLIEYIQQHVRRMQGVYKRAAAEKLALLFYVI